MIRTPSFLRPIGLCVISWLAMLALHAEAIAQCEYETTIIQWDAGCGYGNGQVHGYGMNDHGHVVGKTGCSFEIHNAFVWTPETGVRLIPMPPGTLESVAYDINNNGIVVGTCGIPSSGFGPLGFIYDGKTTQLVYPPGAANWLELTAINDSGVASGWYHNVITAVPPSTPFRYADGEIDEIELPKNVHSARALDINEAGWVSGWAALFPARTEDHRAFVHAESGFRIHNPSTSYIYSNGFGLNADGKSVGHSVRPEEVHPGKTSGPRISDGLVWAPGHVKDVPPHESFVFDDVVFLDISDAGVAVGNHCGAVVAYGIESFCLRHLIGDMGTPLVARDINNHGVIVVDSNSTGFEHSAVLLHPIDSPASDVNRDCDVNEVDLLYILKHWNSDNWIADVTGDSNVNVEDILLLLKQWRT